MRRTRNAKIVATLGPASSDKAVVRSLFLAGVDVFRLNFSHDSADDHRQRFNALRELEAEMGRPIAILADLQCPASCCPSLRSPKKTGATWRWRLNWALTGSRCRLCSVPRT